MYRNLCNVTTEYIQVVDEYGSADDKTCAEEELELGLIGDTAAGNGPSRWRAEQPNIPNKKKSIRDEDKNLVCLTV